MLHVLYLFKSFNIILRHNASTSYLNTCNYLPHPYKKIKASLKYSKFDNSALYFAYCCLATDINSYKFTSMYNQVVTMVATNEFTGVIRHAIHSPFCI